MLRRIFPKREYKSGTGWCFWRWTYVPSGFIVRLRILKTPWFAICLHWLIKPDPEPYLHDHPVSFLSLILRGGYTETRLREKQDTDGVWCADVSVGAERRWWNRITASDDDRHTITSVKPNTLTLCFMGPKTREWGYHTDEGWVQWKTYNERYKNRAQS